MRKAGTRTNVEKMLVHFRLLFNISMASHQTGMDTELGPGRECVRGQRSSISVALRRRGYERDTAD